MSSIIIIGSKCFECVYFAKFKSYIFEGKKFNTCVKLPKGGFTCAKNSTHKQKKKYENEIGFVYKCIYHFYIAYKATMTRINFVFLKKLYNLVIVR